MKQKDVLTKNNDLLNVIFVGHHVEQHISLAARSIGGGVFFDLRKSAILHFYAKSATLRIEPTSTRFHSG